MAIPVVALLLTGGDGIADDGDGDDSDCGEDKLHDGGKLHDGDSDVSTMEVSSTMEVRSTMEVSFTTLSHTNIACRTHRSQECLDSNILPAISAMETTMR